MEFELIDVLIIVNVISLFSLITTIVYFYFKTSNLKKIGSDLLFVKENHEIKIEELEEEAKNLQNNNSMLLVDKTKLESEIKILSYRLNESEEKLKEWMSLKKESVEHAKAAIFEVGKNLSEQLIDLHKKEQQYFAENNNKMMNDTTEKIHNEFMNVIKAVASLSDKVKESVSGVDLIKKSLLNPIAAGVLSETTLENILKSLGLIHGVDYFLQLTVDGENNAKLRPDAFVLLPGNNVIVIDSKSSKHFLEEEGMEDKASLISSMYAHIKALSSKDYKEAVKKEVMKLRPDLKIGHVSVLMFVVSETALEKIQKMDRNFNVKSWENDIFPIGPSGLVNILSHAKFVISETKKAEYADLIVEEVTKLFNSLMVLNDHSRKIGASLKSTVNAYDKFAASFNGNLIPKLQKISSYGISSKNKIDYIERYQMVNLDKTTIEVESEALEFIKSEDTEA